MDVAQMSVVKHKSRKKSSSLKKHKKRAASEGAKHESLAHDVSNRSSIGSSAISLDVRCACQYFQSDLLLPERQNYVGIRPVSHSNILNFTSRDHVYEPVNPPPDDIKLLDAADAKASLTLNTKEEFLKHITFSKDIPNDTISEDFIEPPSAQDFQDQLEDRFFRASTITSPKLDDNFKQTSTTNETQTSKSGVKNKNQSTPKSSTGNNFQEALKTQADKIKIKLQNIRKPNITLPQPPKFSTTNFPKLKFKKPNINVPKMPDLPSIKIASLSLKRKDTTKNSWRKRQYSTESNAGDSKEKKFHFKTYPRIFDKVKTIRARSLDDSFENATPSPVFATVPRTGRIKTSQDHDVEYIEVDEDERPKEYYYDNSHGFVTIPIDSNGANALHMPPRTQYDQDIKLEDDFNGDTDNIKLHQPTSTDWNAKNTNKYHLDMTTNENCCQPNSDQSSPTLSEHRQGVLEEIDSDQFFLREKGISQDDIDVGKYLTSEIKEAFRNPVNALAQLQSEDREYDVDLTDQSQSSEDVPKRKWIKKPKRKKTPHVSNEQMSFELGSDPEEYATKHTVEPITIIPARPKRKTRKDKKPEFEDIIPYQETIPIEAQSTEEFGFIDDSELLYRTPPEAIKFSFPYTNVHDTSGRIDISPLYMNTHNEEPEMLPEYPNALQNLVCGIQPVRPTRRNKSTKIFNAFEVDIDMGRHTSVENFVNGFEECKTTEGATIPNTTPSRPNRKRSHTRSQSATSLQSQDQSTIDVTPIRPIRFRARTRSESIPSLQGNEIITSTLPPTRPKRTQSARSHIRSATRSPTRSRTRSPTRSARTRSLTRSRTRSLSTESLHNTLNVENLLENSKETPCIEERCIQIVCDRMGYAIVDKTKIREPPLPPTRFPKTPPRTRKQRQSVKDQKFATVPRPPDRPLRNYSTLKKPSSKSLINGNILDYDKENVDVNPYIEIDEDELARRLQSGDVIQKMRERPLPAPPRPPRKTRTPTREVFRDISHEQNIHSAGEMLDSNYFDKSDFNYELSDTQLCDLEKQILTDDHEETITHAALVVQPIGNSPVLSHSELFNSERDLSTPPLSERIILIEQEHSLSDEEQPEDIFVESVAKDVVEEQPFESAPENIGIGTNCQTKIQQLVQVEDSDDEGMSEIPQTFYKLKLSEQPETINIQESEEIANLKLQLLDVDELRVNELTPNKVVATDLEGANMHVSEINSKAGNLVISGIELPTNAIQEMLSRLQAPLQPEQDSDREQTVKGSTKSECENDHNIYTTAGEDEPPPVPPRSDSVSNLINVNITDAAYFNQGDTTDFRDVLEPLTHTEHSNSVLEDKQIIEVTQRERDEPPVRPPRKLSQTEKQQKVVNTEKLSNGNFNKIEDIESNDNDEGSLDDGHTYSTSLETSNVNIPNSSYGEQTGSNSPLLREVAVSEQNSCALSTMLTRESKTQSHQENQYVPSQIPLEFYNLVSSLPESIHENNIPSPQCSTCRRKCVTLSKSSSLEELYPKQQRLRRLSESSIPQLTGQLVQSCAVELDRSLRSTLTYLSDNILPNVKDTRDLQVLLLMLVVLIATLILISGDARVEHHHHWEYFNPPREL